MEESKKQEVQNCLRAVYNELGFIRKKTILPDAANETISLLELFVSLRSNVNIGYRIIDGEISEFTVNNLKDNICKITDERVICDSKNLDLSYVNKLKDCVQRILKGEINEGYGINFNKRPLIESPIWSDGNKEDIASLEILSSLYLFNRVVLLGAPGSGKSTIAKVLTCSLIENLIADIQSNSNLSKEIKTWNSENPIPIFIEIRDLVSSTNFPDIESEVSISHVFNFIQNKLNLTESSEVWEYISDSVKQGRVIFIFDGLDEIIITENAKDAIEKRREQIKLLMNLMDKEFSNCKIIITSRPAGYSGWAIKNFDVLRILPLNHYESKEIITSVFKTRGEIDLNRNVEIEKLVNHLTKIPVELRSQPLFVILITLLNLEESSNVLPIGKAELLEYSITLLLKTWAIKGKEKKTISEIIGCESGDVRKLLETIAFKSLSEFQTNKVTEDVYIDIGLILTEIHFLNPSIRSNEVLNFISERAGILNSPSQRQYKFAHRLYLEYLAASYLINNIKYNTLLIDLLLKSFPTWNEVALLICEGLNNKGKELEVWSLIESLAEKQNPELNWLISKIIVDIDLKIGKRKSVLTIVELVKDAIYKTDYSKLTIEQKVDLISTLGKLGDDRVGVGLDDSGVPKIEWCSISCKNAIVGIDETQIEIINKHTNDVWSYEREKPCFKPDIKNFEIAKFPITCLQFNSFIEATDGYQNSDWWTEPGNNWKDKFSKRLAMKNRNNYPQVDVNWYEALAFCRWLSFHLKEHITLPTEIEWEVAAKNCENRLFTWGNEMEYTKANTLDLGYERVMPVGCIDFNLYPHNNPLDLIGNVWEWCSSIVEENGGKTYEYPWVNDERENVDLGDNYLRATRGGYFKAYLFRCRATNRGRDLPFTQVERQGFRVIRRVTND